MEKEELKKKKAEEKAQRAQRVKRSEPTSRVRNLRSDSSEAGPSRKVPRLDDCIDSNVCCVCYQAYDEDTGTDWIQCVCTRWLHEDCIIDCVIDTSGKEKLCPHCI